MRLTLLLVIVLLPTSATAVPLTLEYSVAGTTVPYTYSFRLVLDNHDGSWAGQTWRNPIFGQSPAVAGGATPFANWITDSASYPIGSYNSTYWGSFTTGSGSQHDGPVLINTVGSDDWTPQFVGDDLIWWGSADVLLDQGEMAWTMWCIGQGFSPVLEVAKRVGSWLHVDAIAGLPSNSVPAQTGGGAGFALGAFTVTSHDGSGTLSSITIAASGTGNDSTAFSEIGLFLDANGNGVFDPGVDQRFGQAYTAYPVNDGTLTFTDSLAFNASETLTFLIVAKLNGTVLATPGQTFNTTVTAISATGGPHSGLPTAVIPGIVIIPGSPGPGPGNGNNGGNSGGGGCSTHTGGTGLLTLAGCTLALLIRRRRGLRTV